MFKNLMSFWKGKDFLKEILKDFQQMMDDARNMFRISCDLILKNKDEEGLKDKIYRIDKQINDRERTIRIRIVEHLSLQPEIDLPFSLVLMSVVKDAERLGDYGKNLFEVWELTEKPFDHDMYQKLFDDMHAKLAAQFEKTKQAFLQSDEQLAHDILNLERSIVRRCDIIVGELAKSDMTANKAVCFTLMARYFKRISAHLANIGSSVILPISDLDFFDEKFRHNHY